MNKQRRHRPLFSRRASFLAATFAVASGCGQGHKSGVAAAGTCVLPSSAAAAPATLEATGCFSATGEPAAALRAYTVNTASWASGAEKGRWLALAPAGQAVVEVDGAIELPPASGVWKEFSVDGVRVETRIMLQDANRNYSGFSYIWNEAQNQATLSADGGAVAVGSATWQVPSRAQCLFCHNSVGGPLLGLRSEQLDVPEAAPAGSASQVDAWIAAGVVVAADANVPRPTAWPSPLGDAPLADRARSYLAANCSFCHQPDAPSGTATNYLFTTPLAAMGVCDVAPTRGDLGISGAMLIAPGEPAESVLSARIHSSDPATMMPPVGRTSVDTTGAEVIDAWITAMQSCQGR